MRSIGWVNACVFAGVLASVGTAATPSQAASQCLQVSASQTAHPFSFGPLNVILNAGDVITLSDTSPVSAHTLTVGSIVQNFTGSGSASITVPSTGVYSVTATGTTAPVDLLATLSCKPGPDTASVSQQLANNAQIAVSNGLRTLQNYQEWVTKGVLGSFGMTRGGDTASARPTSSSAPSAIDKAEALVRKERDLREELADLAAGDERAADLKAKLVATQRDLAFARLTVDLATAEGSSHRIASPTSSDGDRLYQVAVRQVPTVGVPGTAEPGQSHDDPGSNAPQSAVATPSVSLDACDFSSCAASDALSRKWNVWMEGRVTGINDSLAQTNSLGFAGAGGVDYKFLPWLAAGMSLGMESTETRFGVPGVRTGSLGVSFVPYVGMRLHENIYAEAFVGVTKLNYNLTPAVLVNGSFDAYRFFLGGAVSGVWYDGNWRFQPSILGAYGSETQNAYTDSSGTAVTGQTITFGRIAAGPEIGYTFKDDNRDWSFEPFALLKANLDFSSSPVYAIGGTPIAVRSGTQGSGQLGGGIAMQLDNGFYLRLQASYDSIGVTGLDVWSGRLRAGKTF
jgi:Autotransporter beta-domain